MKDLGFAVHICGQVSSHNSKLLPNSIYFSSLKSFSRKKRGIHTLALVLLKVAAWEKQNYFSKARDSPSEPRDEWTLVVFAPCDQARTSKVLRRIPREDADWCFLYQWIPVGSSSVWQLLGILQHSLGWCLASQTVFVTVLVVLTLSICSQWCLSRKTQREKVCSEHLSVWLASQTSFRKPWCPHIPCALCRRKRWLWTSVEVSCPLWCPCLWSPH